MLVVWSKPRDTRHVNLGNCFEVIWARSLGILGTRIMVWEGKVLVLRTCSTGLMDPVSYSKGRTAINPQWDLPRWQYCLRFLEIFASVTESQ